MLILLIGLIAVVLVLGHISRSLQDVTRQVTALANWIERRKASRPGRPDPTPPKEPRVPRTTVTQRVDGWTARLQELGRRKL
jgi:hypothetical protein